MKSSLKGPSQDGKKWQWPWFESINANSQSRKQETVGTFRIISVKPGLFCLSSLPVRHALLIPEVWLLPLLVHWHCASQGYQQPINCWTKMAFSAFIPLKSFSVWDIPGCLLPEKTRSSSFLGATHSWFFPLSLTIHLALHHLLTSPVSWHPQPSSVWVPPLVILLILRA